MKYLSLLAVVALAACGGTPKQTSTQKAENLVSETVGMQPSYVTAGYHAYAEYAADGPIQEASALVASRVSPGIFWTLNDSGGRAEIFATTRTGELLCTYTVQGAEPNDWEDMALDDAGNLYISDLGNNRNTRTDLRVFKLREPTLPNDVWRDGAPVAGFTPCNLSVDVTATIPVHYPDQTEFPPSPRIFDCEAIFFDQNSLYLLTKTREVLTSTLYRIPEEGGAAERLQTISLADESDLPFPGMVTAADLSPDGTTLAVLSYNALRLYDWTPGHIGDMLLRVALKHDECIQTESVTFSGDEILFTNEQRTWFMVDR